MEQGPFRPISMATSENMELGSQWGKLLNIQEPVSSLQTGTQLCSHGGAVRDKRDDAHGGQCLVGV